MDLWIRSQDKMSLVKCNTINIDYSKNTRIIANCIPDSSDNEFYFLLGEYETKERALEILDEIQNILVISKSLSGNYQENDLQIKALIVSNMIKVYQMPQK